MNRYEARMCKHIMKTTKNFNSVSKKILSIYEAEIGKIFSRKMNKFIDYELAKREKITKIAFSFMCSIKMKFLSLTKEERNTNLMKRRDTFYIFTDWLFERFINNYPGTFSTMKKLMDSIDENRRMVIMKKFTKLNFKEKDFINSVFFRKDKLITQQNIFKTLTNSLVHSATKMRVQEAEVGAYFLKKVDDSRYYINNIINAFISESGKVKFQKDAIRIISKINIFIKSVEKYDIPNVKHCIFPKIALKINKKLIYSCPLEEHRRETCMFRYYCLHRSVMSSRDIILKEGLIFSCKGLKCNRVRCPRQQYLSETCKGDECEGIQCNYSKVFCDTFNGFYIFDGK